MRAPVVLGPQYPTPNVAEALAASEVGEGSVVVISAGWRLEEAETGALEAAIGRSCDVLPLYRWFEACMQADPALAARYRARQQRVQRYSELYRVRLEAALQALAQLIALHGDDPELVGPELSRAVDDVRRIDADLIERWASLDRDLPELARPFEHAPVAEYHAAARERLEGAAAVLVPGGHVAVLANRLEFFGLGPLLTDALSRDVPLICWSAGAMALSRRIVLFYDDPPQGPAEPEVLGPGLGLLPGVVFFPHARRRLRLEDQQRLSALSLRFAPERCISLENGAWLSMGPSGLSSRGHPDTASVFGPEGLLGPVE